MDELILTRKTTPNHHAGTGMVYLYRPPMLRSGRLLGHRTRRDPQLVVSFLTRRRRRALRRRLHGGATRLDGLLPLAVLQLVALEHRVAGGREDAADLRPVVLQYASACSSHARNLKPSRRIGGYLARALRDVLQLVDAAAWPAPH